MDFPFSIGPPNKPLSPILPPANLPNISKEAHKLFCEGTVVFSFHQLETSLEKFKSALNLINLLNYPEAKARCLYNLGICEQALENTDTAVNYFKDALELVRQHRWELSLETRKYNEQAQAIRDMVPDVAVIGSADHELQLEILVLQAMAMSLKLLGKGEEANVCIKEAVEILKGPGALR